MIIFAIGSEEQENINKDCKIKLSKKGQGRENEQTGAEGQSEEGILKITATQVYKVREPN